MKEEKKNTIVFNGREEKKLTEKLIKLARNQRTTKCTMQGERKRGREIISNMLWPNNEQQRMEDMRMGDKQKADLENKSLNKEQQRETVKIFLFALFFGLPWNVYVFFVYIAFA